jgi:hypothetical protein
VRNEPSGRVSRHAFLDIQLVEAEPGYTRFGGSLADGFDELGHGGELRQVGWIGHQMPKGDQGVGLAAAIGEFELAHGLVVPARHAQHYVPQQLSQVVRREGKGEELPGVLIDRRLPLCMRTS